MAVPPIIEEKLWGLYRKKPELFNEDDFEVDLTLWALASIPLIILMFRAIQILELNYYDLIFLIPFVSLAIVLTVGIVLKQRKVKEGIKKLLQESGFNLLKFEEIYDDYSEIYLMVVQKILYKKELDKKNKEERELDRALRESLEVRR